MNLRRNCILLGIALIMTALTSATVAQAAVGKVYPGESIQAAIDAAAPGDTIVVFPGVYQEDPSSVYGLRITKDHIRLIGKRIVSDGVVGKVYLACPSSTSHLFFTLVSLLALRATYVLQCRPRLGNAYFFFF